jgi:putative salt-induced outer membrane protein
MRPSLLPLIALPLSLTTLAAEPAKPLSGFVDVGYIGSMGTSSGSKDTFRGKVSLTHTGPYWVNTFSAEGINVRDEIPATNDTERYLLNYKARHYFNVRDFFTFRAQWEKDLLTVNDYQAFISLGLGRELLKTDRHFVKVEFGPGVRHTKPGGLPGEDNAMGLFSWDYDGKLTETLRLIQKGSVEAGEENTVTRVNTQLKEKLTDVLALTITHDYRHENAPKDTRSGVLSLGLNYQF